MISEIKKSINSILYQRVTSPLFGTFCIAWLVWNWKIIYTTLFIDEDKINKNKIDYIVDNFNETEFLIWYPLLSTIILLTIIPFLSNGAFWLSLKFEKWRTDKKNEIEKKQLLTLEQSIQLREQIIESEKRFDSLLKDKNDEIKQLKILIEESAKVKSKQEISIAKPNSNFNEKEIERLFEKINRNDGLKEALHLINWFIQGGYSKLIENDNITPKILSFYESNDLIESEGEGMYKWTEKGKLLNRKMADIDFK